MQTLKPVLGTIICLIFVVSVKGKGKFAVILTNMTNEARKDWNNSCCHDYCTSCDTYFKVCLTAFPGPSSISNCTSGVETSGKLGPNSFSMNYRVERPFNIKTQDFGVFIEAWSKDSPNDDLIDQHSTTILAIPTYNGTVITSNSTRLTGKRYTNKTTLDIQYQLYCDRYYYGPTCGIYCKYRDDGNGHYWCNNNGTRVCLNNWYGKNCTDSCFPRDDERGHYHCNSNGTKVCYQNWYGRNCTIWCSPKNSSSEGHYSYLSDGSTKCHPGWYGENCTTYCWHQNNQYSNYTCCKNSTHNFICGNILASTTIMPTSSLNSTTNLSIFSTKLMNLSVTMSTFTIVSTPSKSKVSTSLYVQPTRTAFTQATEMNTTQMFPTKLINLSVTISTSTMVNMLSKSSVSNTSLYVLPTRTAFNQSTEVNTKQTFPTTKLVNLSVTISTSTMVNMLSKSSVSSTSFYVLPTRTAFNQSTEVNTKQTFPTTKLVNLSVSISTSTIVNTPSKSKVSSTLYVQPTRTVINQSNEMSTTNGTYNPTRRDQAWKCVVITLGIVTFLVIFTILLIKYIRARMKRRIRLDDHDENNQNPPHLDDRYAVPLTQLQEKEQTMSMQSNSSFTIPPETRECFHNKNPSTLLISENSFLKRGTES